MSKIKKMKPEREPASNFLNFVFIICLKYLITKMIIKRSQDYVSYQ